MPSWLFSVGTHADRALLRFDEQVFQVADRRQRPGIFVNDVVRHADHAVARPFGNDGMHRRGRVHDARPGMACDGAGQVALVEETVALPEFAPALAIFSFNLANFDCHFFS